MPVDLDLESNTGGVGLVLGETDLLVCSSIRVSGDIVTYVG